MRVHYICGFKLMDKKSLTLPKSLLETVEKYAINQGVSIEQFILWAIAEKIGILSQSLINAEFPNITYFQGASGKISPVIKNTSMRVQTIIIAHYQWKLSISEIAEEYDLNKELIKEALKFYHINKTEIDQMIFAEQGLELAYV